MGRAIQRVVGILEFIAAARDGRTHTELSKGLGIPKSTLTDLLKDLVQCRYLEVQGDGTYLIGPGSLVISRAYLGRIDAISQASDILVDLRDETGETAVLMVRHGLEAVVVAKENSYHPLVATMVIGDRGFLISTAGGKALLAYMDDESINRIIDETMQLGFSSPHTIDRATLKRELQDVREGKMAFSREEWLESIIGVGLPVMGEDGPICSISFGVPITRMTEARILEIEPMLRKAVDKLSARLVGIPRAGFKSMHK